MTGNTWSHTQLYSKTEITSDESPAALQRLMKSQAMKDGTNWPTKRFKLMAARNKTKAKLWSIPDRKLRIRTANSRERQISKNSCITNILGQQGHPTLCPIHVILALTKGRIYSLGPFPVIFLGLCSFHTGCGKLTSRYECFPACI